MHGHTDAQPKVLCTSTILTVTETDRWTDRQNCDSQDRASIVESRGKNARIQTTNAVVEITNLCCRYSEPVSATVVVHLCRPWTPAHPVPLRSSVVEVNHCQYCYPDMYPTWSLSRRTRHC